MGESFEVRTVLTGSKVTGISEERSAVCLTVKGTGTILLRNAGNCQSAQRNKPKT
jgi:hypothetical protein